MANEYVIYWKREVMHRTKIIADSTEEAIIAMANGLLADPSCDEDFDEFGPAQIDNIECIQKDVL